MLIPLLVICVFTVLMALSLPPSRMPIGFSQEDFHFSKLYKCIHEEGRKVMCNVLQTICLCMYSSGEIISIQDHFRKMLKWKRDDMKKKFSVLDRPHLTTNLTAKIINVPVCFMCKVIITGFPDIFNKLDINCQDNIKYIMAKRNEICHEYLSPNLNLTHEINELRRVFREIYISVGEYFQKDFSSTIAVMEKALIDACNVQIRQIDIKTYEEDIEAFKSDSIFKLIVNGQRELKTLYYEWLTNFSKSSISNVYSSFPPLKIENRDILITELLTVKANEEKLPSALLCYGLDGSGKTSLCMNILSNWCSTVEKIVNLKSFDLVFFVQVQTVKSSSLKEYFAKQLMTQTSMECDSPTIPLLQELNILFIIDDFHKSNEFSREILKEIFEKFKNKRIILTTHPQYLENAILLSCEHYVNFLSVEICGFDEHRFV